MKNTYESRSKSREIIRPFVLKEINPNPRYIGRKYSDHPALALEEAIVISQHMVTYLNEGVNHTGKHISGNYTAAYVAFLAGYLDTVPVEGRDSFEMPAFLDNSELLNQNMKVQITDRIHDNSMFFQAMMSTYRQD